MRSVKFVFWVLNMIIPLLLAGQNELSIFQKFTGKEWIGHYQNSPDSLIIHKLKWEFDLNNMVVLETKSVPELNFTMLTYYYQDFAPGQIAFISFMNKAMIRKGVLKVTSRGELELNGKTFLKSDSLQFRSTLNILENGQLADRFYRSQGKQWIPGHFIVYTAEKPDL